MESSSLRRSGTEPCRKGRAAHTCVCLCNTEGRSMAKFYLFLIFFGRIMKRLPARGRDVQIFVKSGRSNKRFHGAEYKKKNTQS